MPARERRNISLLPILAALGCSPSVRWLAPPEGELGTVLAARQSAQSPLSVEIGDPERALLATGLEPGSTLLVAGYASPPEALGLERGPVSAPATCRSCELMAPVGTYLLSGAGEGELEHGVALTPALLDRLLPDRALRCGHPCRSFDVSTVDLGVGRHIYWLVDDGEGRLLAATDDGALFEIDPVARTAAARCRLDGTEMLGARDGADVWLFGPSSFDRLERARVAADAPCPRTRFPAPSAYPRAAAVRRTGTSTDALVLTSTASVLRFVEGAWREVARFPDEGSADSAVVFTGPGRAAVSNGSTILLRIDGGRYDLRDAAVGGDVLGLAWSERFGLVAGIEFVGIMASRDEGWVALDTATGWKDIQQVSIEGERIWQMTRLEMHEYREAGGSCPSIPITTDPSARVFVALPDGRIAHTRRYGSGADSVITIMTPRLSDCPG